MNILTIDIEDWYNCDFITQGVSWSKYEVRIYESVDRILQKLEIMNVKGTFFCLGWIASNHPQIIKKIHSHGHQIGCHSNNHQLVFNLNKKQFRTDTEKAKKGIEDVIGERIGLYRAPGFSITERNPWAFEVLAELGIDCDCSIFPSTHEYGGFPSFGIAEPSYIEFQGHLIKEFPVSTHKVFNRDIVFSGGGYFRLFPYIIIRKWIRESNYNMTYFHPRDFDPDQPKLSHLPIHRKFKSYIGLKNAFVKFEKLLNEFSLISIEEADKIVDWEKVKVIKIA